MLYACLMSCMWVKCVFFLHRCRWAMYSQEMSKIWWTKLVLQIEREQSQGMSAYGHQMEREYSAQSILAGEGSGVNLCHCHIF